MSAGLEEMRDLQQQLRGFVTNDELMDVARRMYDYYTVKEAIQVKCAHEERFEVVEEHLEKVPLEVNTESTFNKIYEQIAENFDLCVKYETQDKINYNCLQEFAEIKKFMKSVDKKFLEIAKKFDAHTKQIENRVKYKELREIKSLIQ
jgi:hypothetical protein